MICCFILCINWQALRYSVLCSETCYSMKKHPFDAPVAPVAPANNYLRMRKGVSKPSKNNCPPRLHQPIQQKQESPIPQKKRPP